MLVQAFESPEVYLGAALVVFLALLIVSTILSTRTGARTDFLGDMMKDFPEEGEEKDGSGRPWPEIQEGLEEEPAHPMPRNIGF